MGNLMGKIMATLKDPNKYMLHGSCGDTYPNARCM
jgi:hypothetical protein